MKYIGQKQNASEKQNAIVKTVTISWLAISLTAIVILCIIRNPIPVSSSDNIIKRPTTTAPAAVCTVENSPLSIEVYEDNNGINKISIIINTKNQGQTLGIANAFNYLKGITVTDNSNATNIDIRIDVDFNKIDLGELKVIFDTLGFNIQDMSEETFSKLTAHDLVEKLQNEGMTCK